MSHNKFVQDSWQPAMGMTLRGEPVLGLSLPRKDASEPLSLCITVAACNRHEACTEKPVMHAITAPVDKVSS